MASLGQKISGMFHHGQTGQTGQTGQQQQAGQQQSGSYQQQGQQQGGAQGPMCELDLQNVMIDRAHTTTFSTSNAFRPYVSAVLVGAGGAVDEGSRMKTSTIDVAGLNLDLSRGAPLNFKQKLLLPLRAGSQIFLEFWDANWFGRDTLLAKSAPIDLSSLSTGVGGGEFNRQIQFNCVQSFGGQQQQQQQSGGGGMMSSLGGGTTATTRAPDFPQQQQGQAGYGGVSTLQGGPGASMTQGALFATANLVARMIPTGQQQAYGQQALPQQQQYGQTQALPQQQYGQTQALPQQQYGQTQALPQQQFQGQEAYKTQPLVSGQQPTAIGTAVTSASQAGVSNAPAALPAQTTVGYGQQPGVRQL